MTLRFAPFFRRTAHDMAELPVEIGAVAEAADLSNHIGAGLPVLEQKFLGILYPEGRPPTAEILSDTDGKIELKHLLSRIELPGYFVAALVVFAKRFFRHQFDRAWICV